MRSRGQKLAKSDPQINFDLDVIILKLKKKKSLSGLCWKLSSGQRKPRLGLPPSSGTLLRQGIHLEALHLTRGLACRTGLQPSHLLPSLGEKQALSIY